MLLRQRPNTFNGLIGVNNKVNKQLQKKGFTPKYLYDELYFYEDCKEIRDYLMNGGEINE